MKSIRPERTIQDYADMLDLPNPSSERHPRMPGLSRAAQFAPFAALPGYEALIEETARTVDRRIELSEEQREEIGARLGLLRKSLRGGPAVRATVFVKDAQKDGGRYDTAEGILWKIDHARRTLTFRDGRVIAMDDLLSIDALDGDPVSSDG